MLTYFDINRKFVLYRTKVPSCILDEEIGEFVQLKSPLKTVEMTRERTRNGGRIARRKVDDLTCKPEAGPECFVLISHVAMTTTMLCL